MFGWGCKVIIFKSETAGTVDDILRKGRKKEGEEGRKRRKENEMGNGYKCKRYLIEKLGI